MKLIEKIKTIKNNFFTFVKNIKIKLINIKNKVKEIYKVITSDKVDVIVFGIAVILSILDFVTTWDLTGALSLLTIYISSLIFRLAIWKLKNKQ